MSRTYKDSPKSKRQPKRVSIRAVRREQPDLRSLRRAIIAEALAEAAAEAQAAAENEITMSEEDAEPHHD